MLSAILSSIDYENMTFSANIEVAIDSFEEISREEDSNDIGGGVVTGDKLNGEEPIEEGFKSSISYLIFLIKTIRAFLNADLSIDQLIG